MLAACLLAAFVAQAVAFAAANGQTYDEAVTLAAGYRIVHDHRDDLNLEHPPLAKVIAALPVAALEAPRLDLAAWIARRTSPFDLGRAFLYEGGVPAARLLALGRAPMILFALAHVALLGAFARRLWGPAAGLGALVLAAFDPNLIAHGALVGHDGLLAFFTTLALFAAHAYATSGRLAWIVAAAGACALAALTKFTGLVVLVAVASAVAAAPLARKREGVSWGRALAESTLDAALLVLAALFVVTLARGGIAPTLLGVRAQIEHDRHGHPAFFLGELGRTGWPAYLPVALLLKCPPLTLAAAGASVALARRGAALRPVAATLLLPAAIVVAALATARVAIGVRYALPLVPILILLGARACTVPAPRWVAAVVAAGAVHHAAAAIRIAPYDLAFFSDLAGGPARGERYLADSNLDWGQDVAALGRFLASRPPPRRLYLAYFGTAQPEAYGVRYHPAPSGCPHRAPWAPEAEGAGPVDGDELLAVSTTDRQGVFFGDRTAYAWLDRLRPVSTLGHAIHVYAITNDAQAHLALARMYERFGPPELAVEERARAAAIAGAR